MSARQAAAARPGRPPFPLRDALLAVVLPLAAFVPLAAQAWQNDAFEWDERLSRWIHGHENRDTILNREFDPFGAVLHPSVQLLGALLVAGVVVKLLAERRLRATLFVALAVAGAAVLGVVLKEVVARPPVDPDGTGHSFPSGHAMRSMAAAAVLTLLAWPTRWRLPTAFAGGVVVALIGIAVVYHEWHWASDALGGWCLAVAWVACLWLALRPERAGDRPGRARTGRLG